MVKVDHVSFPYYKFQLLDSCRDILHFVSSGARDIGFSEEIAPGIIRQNRRILAQAVGFDAGQWVTAHQVHSANVAIVKRADAGRGAQDKVSRLPDTDALVTHEKGICLMVLSADCVPVLLYDPDRQAVAAIHAGWRGTAAKIVAETVRVMHDSFGCAPSQLIAGIGPSIGACCFEVGEEVAEVFRNLFPLSTGVVTTAPKSGKYYVDLWEANRLELLECGLPPKQIEMAGMCSACHPDHFFSYRRDGKKAGRFGAGIMLRERNTGLLLKQSTFSV